MQFVFLTSPGVGRSPACGLLCVTGRLLLLFTLPLAGPLAGRSTRFNNVTKTSSTFCDEYTASENLLAFILEFDAHSFKITLLKTRNMFTVDLGIKNV